MSHSTKESIKVDGDSIPIHLKWYRMRWITRSLNWIVSLLFIFLVGLLAMTLIAPRVWNLDMRSVASGSMAPSIPVGALVIIQPVDVETILPGEIITFQSVEVPDEVVTHRVLEVSLIGVERAFRTQGDANENPDLELVPASRVLGRVVLDVPLLGYLSQFIRTRSGLFLTMIIPAFILIYVELINIIKVIWFSENKPGGIARKRKYPASAEISENEPQAFRDVI